MPGLESDLIPPFRSVHEVNVHPGKDPGRARGDQVVIAESQNGGMPVGRLLRQVHEGRGLEPPRCICIVAWYYEFLCKLVHFSSFANAKVKFIIGS